MPSNSVTSRKLPRKHGHAVSLAAAKFHYVPEETFLVEGKFRLKRPLTAMLEYVASRRKPDFLLAGLIEKLGDQERWADLAEYWLEIPDAALITKRVNKHGMQAELDRLERCSTALERYRRNACYFFGAFKKKNSIATAYFVWEMDQAVLDLDRYLFGAQEFFAAGRKILPPAHHWLRRAADKELQIAAIESSAQEFLAGRTVRSVRLAAETATYVHRNCEQAKRLKLHQIMYILRWLNIWQD